MSIEIHNHCTCDQSDTQAKLSYIIRRLNHIERLIQTTSGEEMADLARLTAAVETNTSAEASAIDLIQQIADELRASATDQAAVNALADQLTASAAALGAAVVANTPAEEPPTDGTTTEGTAEDGAPAGEPPVE